MLAKIYSLKKQRQKKHEVLSSMEPQMQSANPRHKLEWLRLTAAYYQESNHPEKAIQHLENYFALSNTIEAEQKKLTESDIDWQLKGKEQDALISGLKNDKELAVVSLWLTVAFSSMAIFIIYLVYQLYRRSKKNISDLKILNDEIQEQNTFTKRKRYIIY